MAPVLLLRGVQFAVGSSVGDEAAVDWIAVGVEEMEGVGAVVEEQPPRRSALRAATVTTIPNL